MSNIKINKLFFIFSVFSIHLIPFAKSFQFETFPILLLLTAMFIFFFKDSNIKNYIKSNQFIFFLIIYLFLFYLTNLWNDYNDLIYLIKYLIGPIIFISFFHIKKLFGINEIIFFGLFIIFLYLIFIFKPPIIFGLSCNALELFIARLDCSNSVNLNRPFLITPEPSYLSLMLSFYLIILNNFKENIKKNKILSTILIIEIFICFIIYQTHSRIGLFFLCTFLIYKIFYYQLFKNILVIITALIILFNFVLFSDQNLFSKNKFSLNEQIIDSRKLLNLDKIYKYFSFSSSNVLLEDCHTIDPNLDMIYDESKCYVPLTFISIMSVNEPTGFIRIFHNYLSLKASYENKFFGYGIGSYQALWFWHAKKFNVDSLTKTNEVMSKWYPNIENKKQHVQNYFFSILHDCGIIPALLILFIILKSLQNIIVNKNKFGYVVFVYVILTFFLQSSITSPYPWMALSIISFNINIKSYA